jgi:hypothetical protein
VTKAFERIEDAARRPRGGLRALPAKD